VKVWSSFSKLAVSKGGAFGRAPQSAKRFCGVSFLQSFFLCASGCQRKKRYYPKK
jgi:hypothetical protein